MFSRIQLDKIESLIDNEILIMKKFLREAAFGLYDETNVDNVLDWPDWMRGDFQDLEDLRKQVLKERKNARN